MRFKQQDPFSIDLPRSQQKGSYLEWEEYAADSSSSVNELIDDNRNSLSVWFFKAVLSLVFCILFFRIFGLQVVNGEKYRDLSENNRVRKIAILAPRGLIYDAYGKIIAQNSASYNLVSVPFDLPKNPLDLKNELTELSRFFQFDGEDFLNQLKKTKNPLEPIVLVKNLSPDQAILFETKRSEFPGFSIQKIPSRDYPLKEITSHLLGYAGPVTTDERANPEGLGYDTNDFSGKTGIEKYYEKYLHGKNGQSLVEVDAAGRLQKVLGEDQPQPGKELILNIDADLQEALYKSMVERGGSVRKGAAVVLNPKTGAVLALISLPSYNNNLFSGGVSRQIYEALVADKNLPLFNRAISGVYPPGSTVKPMAAAGALQEGAVTADTIIVDRGVLVIQNKYDPSIPYYFRGWKLDGLGPMNAVSAIAESSDIYFYTVAGGHPASPIHGIGPEKLAGYYRKFGLGSMSGIDLPGEKPGLVPDPKWKEEYFKNDSILSQWYLGDTYHIGIGQGDMLATPLQIANMTAVVANGGKNYVPRILQKVLDGEGRTVYEPQVEVLSEPNILFNHLKTVQEGMRQAVLYGSGRQLSSLPISSAGKTGTSQFDGSDPKKTHAWFTAYAPFENPEIVVTVLAEAGGEGHAAAVPVARDILQWWSENRYNK